MKVETAIYLILSPQRDWQGRVEAIEVVNMTRCPPNLKSSQVALKINVAVDALLFEQFIPEATITVKDGRVLITPDVEIDEPTVPENPEEGTDGP